MIGLSSPNFSKFTLMESLELTSFSVFLMKSMGTRLARLWERKSKCYSLRETTAEELILTSWNHGMILRTKDLTRCQGQATAKLVLTSSYRCAQLRWTQSMACSLDNIWTTNIFPSQWDQRISNSKSETRTRIWFLEMKTTCIVWTLKLKCLRNANRSWRLKSKLMISTWKRIHQLQPNMPSLSTSLSP